MASQNTGDKTHTHYWLCGDATIRHYIPGFFDTHEEEAGKEWQVCRDCGQVQQVVLNDPPPFAAPYKESRTALTPNELRIAGIKRPSAQAILPVGAM